MEQGISHRIQLPISENQKRFFFEWALAPEEATYNVSFVHRIIGTLDEKAFKAACQVFITRNEVAHAQYSENGETCYRGEFDIDDFYHELVFNSTEPIQAQIGCFLYKPFNLVKGPLLRLYLSKSDNKEKPEFYFFFVVHHIICDAVFYIQLYSQICCAYNNISAGGKMSFPVEKTFTQAVEAEQKQLDEKYKARGQQFWLDFIGELPLYISLPFRSDAAAIDLDNLLADKTGEFIYFDLDISQSAYLKAYTEEQGSTLFIVLSALYGLVLSKYINLDKFFFKLFCTNTSR